MKNSFLFSLWMLVFGLYLPAQNIPAGDQLIIDGIPSIPKKLASDVSPYTNSRSASFVDFHPTRKEILIATRFGNTSQLHLVKQPLGMRKQITFFEEPVAGALYHPIDGRSLVFSRDAGGNEFAQLYRYDFSDGRTTLLSDGGRSQNGGVLWCHKGDKFLYMSTRRNGADRDVYLMDPLQPGTDKLLLQNTGGGWGVESWSPDDSKFIMSESISVNESRLWMVETSTGNKKRITPEGKEQTVFGDAEFSADGQSVYLLTDQNSEFLLLAKMTLSDGKIKPITTKIPWDVSDFELSPDGSKLVFIINEAGLSKMYLLDTSNDTYNAITDIPEGLIGGLKWHNNNKEIGITLSNAQSTADVYLFNIEEKKLERWTESELGGLNAASLSPASLIRWKSFDGKEISGFCYKPSSVFTGKRPVIIVIHGGPEGQSFPGFQGRNNYYLNELGIALIYPNVRGSTGYGKTFVKLDNGYLRENSVKDIGSLLDWIALQPDLDASRVMTMGGSYGGYMALACATFYSDRLRCSNDIVGISNFNTFLKNTESYRRDLRRVEYGDEQDPKMAAFLEKISPLNNVDKIKIPMFIVQGGNDPRVPRTEATQMAEAIKMRNVPVWYLEAKDEGHGFKKKNNSDYQFYATILFVKKYLLGLD